MSRKLFYISFALILGITKISHAQNCITNLVVEQGDCNTFMQYDLFIMFEHSPDVDSVAIFFDNEFFGYHSTEFQPIVFSQIQSNNLGGQRFIEVVSTLSTNCSDSTSYIETCEFGIEDCLSEIFFVDPVCINLSLIHI